MDEASRVPEPQYLERENSRLTLKLLGVALGAFAFGFALVPLYEVL